jgi:hypothetical protein
VKSLQLINLKSQSQVDELLIYKNEAFDSLVEWTGTTLFKFLSSPMFEVIVSS